MAPGRKKDQASGEASTPQPDQSGVAKPQDPRETSQGSASASAVELTTAADSQSSATNAKPSTQQPRGSWYAGGSWRSKASPVAQIARENISVEGGVSSELATPEKVKQSLSKSARGSRKSIPLIAEATRVHATSDTNDKSLPERKRLPSEEDSGSPEPKKLVEEDAPVTSESKPIPPVSNPASQAHEGSMADGDDDADSKTAESLHNRSQSGAWLGWWSRPEGYASDGERAASAKRQKLQPPEGEEAQLKENKTQEAQSKENKTQETQEIGVNQRGPGNDGGELIANESSSVAKPEMTINPNSSTRSWFGFWSSAQNEQAAAEEREREETEQEFGRADGDPDKSENPESSKPPDATRPDNGENKARDNKEHPDMQRKSSGWAFWSTEKPSKDVPDTPATPQAQVGEIAVADTPSQSHPEAAQFNEQRVQGKKADKKLDASAKPTKGKDTASPNISKLREEKPTPKAPIDDKANSQTQISAAAQLEPASDTAQLPGPAQKAGKRVVQNRPNLVLPSFRETYHTESTPGYIERLTHYLAQTLHLPGSQPPKPPNHILATATPPRIRKAIAIGVHGFFPAPLVQKLLGPPTGTSVRFANHAAAAIQSWCKAHHPETAKDVEIEKIALEGEGYITDRVSTLWKLLLNWLAHLRQADFILVACHSQGVPVGITLVAKLIQLGCLAPNVRVGVCAMAGINLGPFIEYKSRLFGGSALELFDFCDSQSKVSRAYAEAVEVCLRHGVRVTVVGSLDDQLVSLESSLHMPVHHPYVSRAVYIDGRLHALDFLTRLVVFAVQLRNLGISDHGFIREISAPLAGSLVGGDGHSRIYDEPAVYQTAIEFALESTSAAPEAFASSFSSSLSPLNLETPAPDTAGSDAEKARLAAVQRRASLSGYPTTTALANRMRRGSLSSSTGLPPPGIAPLITPYETSGNAGGSTAAEKNPFVLPWAVRGMLEEELIKRDNAMQDQVRLLVKDFEAWRPVTKVLKDVRWRLEGVRSML